MTIKTRDLHPGMGQAVAERTILRYFLTDEELAAAPGATFRLNPREEAYQKWNVAALNSGYEVVIDAEAPIRGRAPQVVFENWGDVAHRVAYGNSMLAPTGTESAEYQTLNKHLSQATLLMSGRHLQHGDEKQPYRNMEVFTNCLGGDTQILTMEWGPVAIRDVANTAVTVIAGDGVPRLATIFEHGVQPTYDIVFKQNTTGSGKYRKTVRATANHRWKLRDGSVTTTLAEGDIIAALPVNATPDPQAVVHGLIFGDGTAHKRRLDHAHHFSQGRTYAGIRVCKQDSVKEQIHMLLDQAGYSFTTPASAKGDRCYYIGKFEGAKELPFTRDPDYIAGFLYGWWLADGHKGTNHALEISTANAEAADWIETHAAYCGYSVTMHRVMNRVDGDGSFANGKPLHILRIRRELEWKVESITPVGSEPVFCPEEPETGLFVLANGLLTGNCATAPASFILFYLLLNGSGVGTSYDDDMCLVNWDNAPTLRCVLDESHPDFDYSAHESVRNAKHKYGTGRNVIWFEVPDSREGWAKAVEIYENAAFERIHAHKLLILDFSKVRAKGAPIKGMQNRPSSGPVPLMNALLKVASLKGGGLAPWLQAMYVDHYLAECVLVGGARRAARMATKTWRDKTVLDFIGVKRPIEFQGSTLEEITAYRRDREEAGLLPPNSFLWSSNNSVTVDKEFWTLAQLKRTDAGYDSDLARHARKVFKLVTEYSYGDGTGEPGLINVDHLVQNNEGLERIQKGNFFGSSRYQPEDDTAVYLRRLAKQAASKPYPLITNPCGEIPLHMLGGFCVIADVVPYHAETLDEAEEAFRVATRALMRVNTMESVYDAEVRRTNRIGVGITGVHEFAWKFFGFGFRDLLDEIKAQPFWQAMARFNAAVQDEARRYAQELGVGIPHTMMTVKPAGTTSKLFGLTEGWHLPSMAWYLRWVQFRHDDPLVMAYKEQGYPVRELRSYEGTVIVGFPTEPALAGLGLGDKLVTAGEAAPEEQYLWLMLGEKYFIRGMTGEDRGGQISYTLKYDPERVSFRQFSELLGRYQAVIRCCSVMPQVKAAAYEYQPEEPLTKAAYEAVAAQIRRGLAEDVDREHVDCVSGACPIDFVKEVA